MHGWRHPTVTVRQDANRMQFAAGKAVGVARVVEVVFAADEARLAWKEASNVAVAARQHADTMQVAAEKAVGLARVVGAACPTAKNVAQGTT